MQRLIFLTLLAAGCQSDSPDSNDNWGTGNSQDTSADIGEDSGDDTGDDTGESSTEPTGLGLYLTHCAPCHGQTGMGNAYQGPPLDEAVAHNTEAEIIQTILKGSEQMEPIDVSQAEAALIASYVKNDLF